MRKPRVKLDPKASYLVVGGLGGIGKSIVRLLVARGARHILLISRNVEAKHSDETLVQLRAEGVDVMIRNVDISNGKDLEDFRISIESSMPPCKGVIQAAMVLQVSC